MGHKAPRTYTLSGGNNAILAVPLDTTVYYIGGTKATITTTLATAHTTIPISGIIRAVCVQIYAVTVAGSNENWILSLYDGTTTTPIATVGLAAGERNWINTDMNFPVTKGGYVTVTTTTPAWGTNPEGITAQFLIVVEYE